MDELSLNDMRLGVVGTGVMAEAMLAGWLAKELVMPQNVRCSHPRAGRRDQLTQKYGVTAVAENVAAVSGAEVILLAVKPQLLSTVAAEIESALAGPQLVISVLAGVQCATLTKLLNHQAVIRTVPNTPAQIDRGVTVWHAAPDVDERGRQGAATLLSALGKQFEVEDEAQVAMATAISGTGPAYTFLFMEALIDTAVHLGFPRHFAQELVMNTVHGSAEFALQSNLHMAQLRDMVTSPGGTTAQALYELEKGRLRTVISDAVWAAFKRTLSLEDKSASQHSTGD